MLVRLHSADRTGIPEETLDISGALAQSGASGPFDTDVELELFPLVKKPGASFADRITIGRTHNNDIAVIDHSVSRFHAYVRQSASGWVVADAGSKNGSRLRGAPLEPRREQPLSSKSVLRLGEVDLTFYVAADLYEALGGV